MRHELAAVCFSDGSTKMYKGHGDLLLFMRSHMEVGCDRSMVTPGAYTKQPILMQFERLEIGIII